MKKAIIKEIKPVPVEGEMQVTFTFSQEELRLFRRFITHQGCFVRSNSNCDNNHYLNDIHKLLRDMAESLNY